MRDSPDLFRSSYAGAARVVSKRAGGLAAAPDETIVSIDRTNPVLGNRHILHDHSDPIERARVIAAHRCDVEQDLARGGPVDRELAALTQRVLAGERLALACWCKMKRAPRACHGDLYVAEIERRVKAALSSNNRERSS